MWMRHVSMATRCSEESSSIIVRRKLSTIMWKGWFIFLGEFYRGRKMKPVFLAACGAKMYETLKRSRN